MNQLRLRCIGAAFIASVFVVACGRPEQLVLDKYFLAVNSKDDDTLRSFALVKFEPKGGKVDNWVIKQIISETKDKAPLSDLLKKQKEIEAAIAKNKKEYQTYNLDHMEAVDQVRTLRKEGGKIPPKLTAVAATWGEFEQKERGLNRQLGVAKKAVETEKQQMMVSIGNVDEVEGLEGDVLNKQLEIDLTIGGQTSPYLLTLRKYDVQPPKGMKLISRWIISAIQPKA